MTDTSAEDVGQVPPCPTREVARRFEDLTAEDDELVSWAEDEYPPALRPLLSRFVPPGTLTLNVDQGWWPLLRRLDNDIAAVDPNYRITRLGKDLGVLDIEFAPGDLTDEIALIVEHAQSESIDTCVVCADRADGVSRRCVMRACGAQCG